MLAKEDSEVPVEATCIMCPTLCSIRAAKTAHYEEFLMQDTRVTDQHTSYQSKILHLVLVIKRSKVRRRFLLKGF
ncbi:unnamed protein product [Prunus armeniaca]|uniref:Uncharacterized protein n=1 Tax=Prunus armeniaca TaxID=36596 RepID=A0A6J5TNK8_PRUAR|nr:unnamed protein product [Prunus armeniaca]CAB4294685.1 unnamed protein product [Prunus armeniaca]